MYEQYPVVLATAAFITDVEKKHILVVKKSDKEKIDAGLWTVPGGKVHPPEPIVTSLKREVKEEVGLEVETYTWIGEDVFMNNERYFHAQHFQCTVAAASPVILEPNLTSYRWISSDKLSDLEFPSNIKRRIEQILKNDKP